MSVTIVSKREFRIDSKDKMIPLLDNLRKQAKKQKGCIFRGTYSNLNDPGEFIVISEWETVEDWRKWMDKKEIRQIQGKIDSLIGERTLFEIYLPEEF